MSNEPEPQSPLREILASVKGPEWWENPDIDPDKLALQAIEGGGSRRSTKTLDALIAKLDGKKSSHEAMASEEPQLPEDDLFLEHPMTPQESASAKINAIGQYAKIMIVLAQLRSRTAGWVDMPTSDELNDAFQKAGKGDIEKQLSAAENYAGGIAAIIEDNMQGWQKFQGHIGRVEAHLVHKVEIHDLSIGFGQISKGITQDLLDARRRAAYIGENVISIERYPLPAPSPAGNS